MKTTKSISKVNVKKINKAGMKSIVGGTVNPLMPRDYLNAVSSTYLGEEIWWY